MAALALRTDYDASRLRALAKASKNGGLTRRLLSLAAIYDGGSRTDAARLGDVGTADRSRLGSAVQRPWSGGARRRQGARTEVEAR